MNSGDGSSSGTMEDAPTRKGAGRRRPAPRFSRLLAGHAHFDVDGHHVIYHAFAVANAEVMAIDLERALPRDCVLGDCCFDGEGNLLGFSVQREFAGDVVAPVFARLDLRGLEGGLRKLGRVKEVLALEVVVQLARRFIAEY